MASGSEKWKYYNEWRKTKAQERNPQYQSSNPNAENYVTF
jgi:hypothetical protein